MSKKQILKCWCKKCGRRLKNKREYIDQDDTCDKCFIKALKQKAKEYEK